MRRTIAVILHLLVLTLFLFSLVISQSDAQGIFVFFFTLPVMVTFSAIGIALAHTARPPLTFQKHVSVGILAVYLGILVSAFVPGLNRITQGVFDGAGKGFELVTGKTPYQYFNARAK